MRILAVVVACLAPLASAQFLSSDGSRILRSAKGLPPPVPRFAVINAPDADYLQSEFIGFPTGTGMRIDSLVFRNPRLEQGIIRGGLEVHWRWVESGRDSITKEVLRLQILSLLTPPAVDGLDLVGSRQPIQPDSIKDCHLGQCGLARIPKVVENLTVRQMGCIASCPADDSAMLVERIRASIRTSGVALVVHPQQASFKPMRSPWRKTTGAEEIPTLCAGLPGNAANWIAEDIVRMGVSPIVAGATVKPNIPPSFDYRTGPASYMYDRTADPNSKILEDEDLRVVDGTLVKIGKSLLLHGSEKAFCGARVDDSLVGLHSWFVVPDSTASVEAIEEAMYPSFCQTRKSAWRMNGDTVWLGRDKWPVPVSELVPLGGAVGREALDVSHQASLVGNRLVLPWNATVTIRDLGGRRLGTADSFPAGVHDLDLAGHRGAFLVEIRGREGAAQVLKGNALSR